MEKSINKPELTSKYQKEGLNSLNIAIEYRKKLNPVDRALTESDMSYIKNKIINSVKDELTQRISKGYQGIDLSLIDGEIDKILKSINIS